MTSPIISSFENASQLHDALINKSYPSKKAYIFIKTVDGKKKYVISDHIDGRVQDYAFKTFKRIEEEIAQEKDSYKLVEWRDIVSVIHNQYLEDIEEEKPGALEVLTSSMRHSDNEVEKEYEFLFRDIEKRYQSMHQKQPQQTHLESDESMHLNDIEKQKRINQHRNPSMKGHYDSRALTKNFIDKRWPELVKSSPEIARLDALIAQEKQLKQQMKDLENQLRTLPTLDSKRQDLFNQMEPLKKQLLEIQLQDPLAKRQIAVSRLKEQATQEAYDREMPRNIQAGFYDPGIIPTEMKQVLGVGDAVPTGIQSLNNVKNHIHAELYRFRNENKINQHQYEYIWNDIKEIIDRYHVVYPNRTPEEIFIFTRDLARIVIYQEIFDKSSFSGSDHGSKHVHNNIKNCEDLHKNMEHSDYSEKDKLLESIVHCLHDIGYTVPGDFNTMKDHPLIGAKMIEMQRAYFERYLDPQAYEVLHKCVLYHAIAMPNLTESPGQEGLHYEMVRSATSISDACAVTYDRKTQEFWEHPRAVKALARLKFFLIQFPQYKKILGNPGISKDEWLGLNKNDPFDRLAHDVFKGVKKELYDLVNNTPTIDPKKKELFRMAIEENFNAFTANVTLGQYGGVLTDLDVVQNPNGIAAGGEGPKYLPKLVMAPSLVYGVLRDLFGKDQANEAFKKLCEEFGGDVKDIESAIVTVAHALSHHEHADAKSIKTGVAVMEITPNYDVNVRHKHYKHLEAMQNTLKHVTEELIGVYAAADLTKDRELSAAFQEVRNGNSPLQKFMLEYIQPLSILPHKEADVKALMQDEAFAHDVEFLLTLEAQISKLPEKDREKSPQAIQANDLYQRLYGRIKMLIITDRELQFIIGI